MFERNHLTRAVLIAALSLSLAACGTVRAVRNSVSAAFTPAQVGDLELEGVRSHTCVAVSAAAEADTPEAQQAISGLLEGKTVGCLLGLTRVGEFRPFWIFCAAGEMERRCREIPSNARVTFAGQPLGLGGIFVPNRIAWSDR